MAKKNSTKTATKEALQNSEPKLQAFRQWKGINFAEVSPLWNDYVKETFTEDRQTDLPPNFLLVQNNLRTTNQAAIETTFRPRFWVKGPGNIQGGKDYGVVHVNNFTGVNLIDHNYGYFAVDTGNGDAIMCMDRHVVNNGIEDNPQWLKFNNGQTSVYSKPNQKVTDMLVYLNRLICMVEKNVDGVTYGGIYATNSSNEHQFPIIENGLLPGYELEPQTTVDDAPSIASHGELQIVDPNASESDEDNGDDDNQQTPDDNDDEEPEPEPLWSAQCSFFYCLTNQWGSTQPSTYVGPNKQSPEFPHTGEGATKVYFDRPPIQWTNQDYITISGTITHDNMVAAHISGDDYQPISVDIFMLMNEYTYPIFVGHTDAIKSTNDLGEVIGIWSFDYYGSMTDVSEWSNANLIVPDDNTTGGVPARYITQIDGRMYFWGDPAHPYRLYIGGNADHELSVAMGHGGAYCDIEPGSGCEIKLVEKFKTYGGSSIVTVLCSNVNGTRQHRYNLIETNIIATSELSTAGYMVEEIANVVGTTSRHGGGAWSDGLYYINRNGLLVTTQQMEYSSQLRSILVSEPISPVFEDQKGTEIANSYVTCIRDIIYMATCDDSDNYVGIDHNVSHYNSFIWCYDIGLKAWYTMQPTIKWEFESEDEEGNPIVDDEDNLVMEERDVKLIPAGLFAFDHEDSVYYGLGVVDPLYGVYVCPLLSNQETHSHTFLDPQPYDFETGELGTSNPNTQWQWLCQLEFNFDYYYGDMEIEINGVDYYGRRMHIVKQVHSPLVEDSDEGVLLTAFNVPIRIDTLVRYYHISIHGDGMFRLNNIVARTYTQSKKIGIVYGFDAEHYYMDRFNSAKKRYMHDAVSCYNNLDKLAYTYHKKVFEPTNTQMPELKETAIVT